VVPNARCRSPSGRPYRRVSPKPSWQQRTRWLHRDTGRPMALVNKRGHQSHCPRRGTVGPSGAGNGNQSVRSISTVQISGHSDAGARPPAAKHFFLAGIVTWRRCRLAAVSHRSAYNASTKTWADRDHQRRCVGMGRRGVRVAVCTGWLTTRWTWRTGRAVPIPTRHFNRVYRCALSLARRVSLSDCVRVVMSAAASSRC